MKRTYTPGIIFLLTVIISVTLFIPFFNPTRFIPQISKWSYAYFLGNPMQVDKLFAAGYTGIMEMFFNNAVGIFCGYILGIFTLLQLISSLFVFSKDIKKRSRSLTQISLFSAINFFINLAIISDVMGADTTIQKLGYDKLGMHYVIPAGTFVFMALNAALFITVRLFRRTLLIENGHIMKMTRSERNENLKGLAYISPFLIGFICFTALPLIFSLFSSFTYYNITSVQKWYGLNNLNNLIHNHKFWISLYNTFWYVIVSVPFAIVIALAQALLMNMKNIKGLRFFRTVYYLPSVLAGVAVFLLWQWILEPSGLLNNALGLIGIHGPTWLYNPVWTRPSLVLIKLWGVGGSTVILLSALQSVPQELYEATTIDGASVWQKFRNITLPMISPTTFFIMVTGISGAFQAFDGPFLLISMSNSPGTGGPGDSLLFYNVNLYYTAMKDQQMGLASTMAWILFVIIMLLTLGQMRLSRKWVYYEGEESRK